MPISTLRTVIILLRLFVISGLLLLYIPITKAEGNVYQASTSCGTPHHTTASSAESQVCSALTGGTGCTSCGAGTQFCNVTNATFQGATLYRPNTNCSGGSGSVETWTCNTGFIVDISQVNPCVVGSCTPPQVPDGNGGCEDPPTNMCGNTAGDIQRDLIGASPVAFVCISGCRYENSQPAGGMVVTSTGSFTTASTVTYVGTGEECDNSEQTNDPPTNTNVTDTDSDGIPEVNGNELPETPPPSDGCTLLPDGSLYCGSNASTPPAPDDGTPGQQATPDQTVTNTTNNTTNNYYDSNTTGNSSSGVPDGQDVGVCDPAVETCGTDQGSASDNGCGALPECTGDPILCVTLKMQHDTRCNLQSDTEDITEAEVMTQLGVTETVEEYFAVDESDPNQNIDVGTIITTTPGTSACPADISITVPFMPTAVVIPNTPICDFLSYIRPAVIALSYLVSGLMLFSAFKEGL